MAEQQSKRRKGIEFRAATWMVRHPGWLALPTGLPTSAALFGVDTTAGVGGVALAAGAAVCTGWYRGHPDSFDRFAAPVLRAWRRRWWTYMGWRWRNAVEDCGLTTENRRTGEVRRPRILRVRSWTPTTDVITVKMVPGQAVSTWEQQLPVLTEALKAVRLGVAKVKPRVINLVIQRSEPFTEVIPAPEMPGDVREVDLDRVYVGETEYGTDLTVSLTGDHVFIAGATGAGKNSIPASMLRGIAPLVRDGVVRLWIADPKQLEFSALAPVAYKYATSTETDVEDGAYTIADLIKEFRKEMEAKQAAMSAAGLRSITPSRETPLDLLILDELGAITAYGDIMRLVRRDLAVIATQGRATLSRMWGLVQEPTKDTVPIRDLFTFKVCLRVTASGQVDMVLGDNARARGALADEIPNIPAETAGIGFVMDQRTRVPIRVRAAYVTDAELAEFVRFVSPGHPGASLKVVA
ncbi:cell division protein FtsK [Actinokineospora sp. PR83]|uniref:FtsK/SpoIIIE domain-containing protein n=1 Tax=Actinokineospora sp. PR83 TaxID=2884908 RepID=UPI001F3A8707|nr:FtsK/SpoIIIE domain-containing protein [Actinokineospora sp. PR83]MCG8919253.1 cell division protein FtsK [Actinokineospora sp. PR83]